jgi:NAD(P)-dependent dehydrogenase (short-subunit alcohol dehydrogenase family)
MRRINMLNDFNNKTVLITGGTSGIGRACVQLFAAYGAEVIIVGRQEEEAHKIIHENTQQNSKVHFIFCDFKETQQIKKLFLEVRDRFKHLDIAINNAGIEGKSFTKLVDYSEEIWDEVIQVNLKAVWLCLKEEISIMLQGLGGVIINVSSLAGLKASLTGGVAYTASKHGVVGLTRSAAKEYAAKNIRVNCVCPAIIKTPMAVHVLGNEVDTYGAAHHPIGRVGLPEEVASTILWLASPKSSFITGSIIPIDGGVSA